MIEPTKEQIENGLFAFLQERSAQMGEHFSRADFDALYEANPEMYHEEYVAMTCAIRAALEVNVENTENSTGEKVCLSAGDNKNACPSDLPENEKQTDGLLPCPFCGGAVTLEGLTDSPIVGVKCVAESHCNGSGLLIALADRGEGLAKAIAAWNTRANESAIRADERKRVVGEIADKINRFAHASSLSVYQVGMEIRKLAEKEG